MKTKKLTAALLALILTVASMFNSTSLTLFDLLDLRVSAEESTYTRAEWISKLVQVLNITTEKDEYPDNYFGDLEESSEYYGSFMTAVNYGLIDLNAGENIDPEGNATREFVVHTLNAYIGVQKNSEDYSFGDSASTAYPDDAQVAVENDWLSLDRGNFLPNKAITSDEAQAMLTAAKKFAKKKIDSDYESKYEFAEGVVEVPNTTPVEIVFEGDSEIVKILNLQQKIAVGDVFAVWYNGYPCVYKAASVTLSDKTTVIVAAETDKNAAIVSMDEEYTSSIDTNDFEGEEGTKTYYINSEEEAAYVSSVRGIRVENGSVIVDKKIDLGSGVSFTVSGVLSNLQIEKWGKKTKGIFSDECGAMLYGDITLTGTISADLIKAMGGNKSVTLGCIRVAGIGKIAVTVDFKLNAKGSLTYSGGFSIGAVRSKGYTRFVTNFVKHSFNSSLTAEADIGLALTAGVDVVILSGSLTAKAGICGKYAQETYNDGKTPNTCATSSAYIYAYFRADAKFLNKKWFDQKDLFTAKTVP